MIHLSIFTKPQWLDLPHDVRVYVRPLTTAIYEAARTHGWRLARTALDEHFAVTLAGGKVENLPDLKDADAVAGVSQMLFTQALAKYAIVKWEGVLAADSDEPMPVTPQAIEDLMSIPSMAEEFVSKYTANHIRLASEGNASGSARNGTSGTGHDIAVPARKKTPRARKESAAKTANAARTGKTHPKP